MATTDINTPSTENTLLKEKYGPWVMIAGASTGVGAAFARHFAALGLNCILIARRVAPLETLRQELVDKHGVEVLLLPFDLSENGVAARIEKAVEGRSIGMFIYNAGGDPYITKFLNTSASNWASLVRMNTQTIMECCHIFGGLMVERGRGGIVLVGSHAALGGVKKLSVYSATKAFGLNLGESLWAEWSAKGVNVLNLLIGATDTPHMRESMAKLNIPGIASMELAKPEDVVRAAIHHLPHGPTLIYPDDQNTAAGNKSQGALRREHVIQISATSALFIGDD